MLYINNAILRKKKPQGEPFIFEVEGDSFAVYDTSNIKKIDWGDGVINSNTSHSYASSDRYVIKVYPDLDEQIDLSFGMLNDINRQKIKKIIQWGNILINVGLFQNTNGFDSTDVIIDNPIYIPETLSRIFSDSTFNQPIDNWDISHVKELNSVFQYNEVFNQPLNNWDTSNVEMMFDVFNGAKSFNKPINNWDVSKVEDKRGYVVFRAMFKDAESFVQDISNWCVENIPTKPLNFDYNTDPNWTEEMKPKWGDPC